MASSARKSHTGGKTIGKDIKLKPGDPIDMEVIVDVENNPLHIFGRLPEGHTVSVYRVYDGRNECVDAPDIPVMCKDGCSPLMLFNEPNPECPTGRFIQDDIWLFYQGRYKLVYSSNEEIDFIPEDVYIWCKEDKLVSKIGINLPLCGENACPPECTSKHVMELESDSFPTAPPDCLRCESPLAFHYDEDQLCDLAFYMWSKAPLSKCSDDGEYKRINFAEWLDGLGGLITAVNVTGDDSISGTIEITTPNERDCVERTLSINLSLGCPPPTADNIVSTQGDGTYASAVPVWVCVNGSPQISTLVLNCPDESGTVEFSTEGGQLRSENAVWTCDINGNPIRSDLIINCPDEAGVVTIRPEGGEMRSDLAVWTCDGNGNPIISDIILECPVSQPVVEIESGVNTALQFWACDSNGNIVKVPLTITVPDLCTQIQALPGSAQVDPLEFGESFNVLHPSSCTNRIYTLPDAPPPGCCPVIFGSYTGNSGGTCFDIAIGETLWDSRVDMFHLGALIPNIFTVTNPTNNVGVVHVSGQGFAMRYTPNNGAPAQVLIAVGLKSQTDRFGKVGLGVEPAPYESIFMANVAHEINDLPNGQAYDWFGNFGGHLNAVVFRDSPYTSASMYKQFAIDPGQTLTFESFFAIGYDTPLAGVESFHGGSAASFQFVGYND